MAMQHRHRQQPYPSKATPLRAMEHPNAFGAHLRFVRQRQQLTQSEVAEALPQYFEEYHVTFPTSNPNDMYCKVENGKRAAQYEELLPIYATLVGCGVKFAAEERHIFVQLARQKLEGLQRKRPKPRPDSDWDYLEAQLARIDQQPQHSQAKQVLAEILIENMFDMSHVVGRESWLATALSYLEVDPPKKLIVVQGLMGSGKSTCLKLLLHTLAERETYQPILHLFSDRKDMLTEDHFDNFLASVLARLEVTIPEVKTPSRQEQIQLLLTYLMRTKQRVILLLDDVQVILDEHGHLPAIWEQFFIEYLHRSHRAAIYLATREWTGWTRPERIYVVDGDEAMLPPLAPQAGAEIWRRFGFTDVEEAWLQRATHRLGGNPRMIELRAATLPRRKLSFSWQSSRTSTPTLTARPNSKSEHQALIEWLVEEPQVFGTADAEVNSLLQQAISQRISHDAYQLLEVLAVSPLALPFPLLKEVTPQAEYAFVEELLNASLIDRALLAQERAGVHPLTKEAILHQLFVAGRVEAVERQVTQLYTIWMSQGAFQDDHEQAQVVVELLLLYLRQYQLMEAIELLIDAGWLCYHFGYGPRLARACQKVLTNYNWKQSPQQVLAANLLYDRLAAFRGEKITTAERAKRYQTLYKQAQEHGIHLAPSVVAHLLQFIVFYLADIAHFEEAQSLVRAHLTEVTLLKEQEPVTFASYLYCQAYLYGRWGEYELPEYSANPFTFAPEISDPARAHLEEATKLLAECITLLKESERSTSQLQSSRAIYKRARRLHNYAYYARLVGTDLQGAKQSLEMCIDLEKQGYTTPGSLATAYAEYAQALAAIGCYQTALEASGQALDEIEKDAALGYAKAEREKAVFLVERADIHLIIGNLDEAKRLYSQAKPYLEHETRREKYLRKAETGLKTITHLENSLRRASNKPISGQLDRQWCALYSKIADFDVLDWLDPAGPFSPEEQTLWRASTEHGKVDELHRLMNNSLNRELDAAIAEQRSPWLAYPAIPILTVQEKIEACQDLKNRIGREEPNQVVKHLYLEALEEEINLLRMVEAIYRGDKDTLISCGQLLFSVPTAYEMEIATGELLKVVECGLQREETRELSQQIKKRLQTLSLQTPRHNSIVSKPKVENDNPSSPLLQQVMLTQTTIPVDQGAQFLQECFREYNFDEWEVRVKANATSASVDANIKQLVLPERDLTAARLLHLLAHEVECHVYRHDNGAKSKLSLLGYGLAGYSPIEEALAVRYTAEVEQKKAGLPWIGTLATGLASGVTSIPEYKIQPLTYYELHCIMRDYHELNQLLQGKDTQTAKSKAYDLAHRRCLRTYLGEVCWPQDNTYLHGTLQLDDYIQNNEDTDTLERLYVGCISTQHLFSCFQLGITKPVIPHKQLAKQEDVIQAILNLASINSK